MSIPRTIRLAVIEGDGIGHEVVPEGLRVLRAALEGSGAALETTPFDLGAGRWHRTGETLTEALDLEVIEEARARGERASRGGSGDDGRGRGGSAQQPGPDAPSRP